MTRFPGIERMNGKGQVKGSPQYWIHYGAPLEMERRIAEEIMAVVRKLDLPLKLDQLTKGEGNCFPIAIMQQCKRLMQT